jgi:hypothetical protein
MKGVIVFALALPTVTIVTVMGGDDQLGVPVLCEGSSPPVASNSGTQCSPPPRHG